MRLLIAAPRRFLLILLIALGAAGSTACAHEEGDGRQFELSAQAAGPALNQFAMQADIVLIFPYDRVAGLRTLPLSGRFTIDTGLSHLLRGTGLGFRRGEDGTYLICGDPACAIERSGDEAPDGPVRPVEEKGS